MQVSPKLQQPAWLLLYLLVGFVLFSGSWPLFDVDEGAFSEATREMLESGVWSATYLDGVPRYDKPILTYWVQAISVSLFGLNEWALRLHALLSGLLWAGAVYAFARQVLNRQAAGAALLIFSTTLLVIAIGRAATADTLLNLFIALSLFDIYRYAQGGERRHVLRSWLWISLGMLTKGPVAAAIPFIVSAIWFGSYGRWRDWSRAILNPLGWLMLLAILTPWLYFVWQEQGSGFFHGFLVEHNLNRFTATKEGHGGHLYYYLLVLPLVLMPWSGMLVLLRRARRLWRRPLDRLLLTWFVVVFVLVSLSETQLPHYMLYGVTPLLLLFAKYRRAFRGQHWHWLFPALFCAIPLTLAFSAERLAGWQKNLYLQEMLARAPEVLGSGFLAWTLALCAAVVAIALTRLLLWQKLALSGLLQTLFAVAVLTPAVAELQQSPVKEAAEVARRLDTDFIAHGIHMPSFSVYRDAATPRREPNWGDYLFTRSDRLAGLQQRFGADAVQLLYHKGGIVLLRIAPASSGGQNHDS